MNFFIKQHSEEPNLKLKLIDDGKYDKKRFAELLNDADITIDILSADTGDPVVFDAPCHLVSALTKFNFQSYDNFILYKFTKNDTSKKGIFEGKIKISYTDDSEQLRTLLLPIHEKLYIHVI